MVRVHFHDLFFQAADHFVAGRVQWNSEDTGARDTAAGPESDVAATEWVAADLCFGTDDARATNRSSVIFPARGSSLAGSEMCGCRQWLHA